MNWNSNDTKYILKRFIIYVLICVAMFIIGTWKAHALEIYTITPNSTQCSGSWRCTFDFNNIYDNRGVIDIIGQLRYQSTADYPETVLPSNVRAVTYNDTSYVCDIGNTYGYDDSSVDTYIMTFKCKIKTTSGNGLKWIQFETGTNYGYLFTVPNITVVFGASDSELSNIENSINNVNNSINGVNNSINNDNVNTSDADDFKNNQAFSDSTGLESVIQLPLNMVNSLTSTCQPIQVTIPFIDYTGEIPCMSTIYRSKFNTLYTIVKLVINGFFVYRLLLKIYELVHSAKQPDEDKLEVIEL